MKIMDHARVAKVYTTRNPCLRRGNASYEDADVLYLTEEESRVELLKDPHIYWKPIVVCGKVAMLTIEDKTF